MSDQNPLDDFLKRKLSERTYTFQESYWDAAEGLIEADRKKKKKRGFLWWWIGGLGLLALSVGVASLWNGGHVSTDQPLSTHSQITESQAISYDSLQIVQNQNSDPTQAKSNHPNKHQEKSYSPSPSNPESSSPQQSDTNQTSAHRQESTSSLVFNPLAVSQETDRGTQIREERKEVDQSPTTPSQHIPKDLSSSPETSLATVTHTANSSITNIEEPSITIGSIDAIAMETNEYLFPHTIPQHMQPVSLSEYVRKNYLGIRLGYTAAEGFQNKGSSISPRSYQGYGGIHYARRLGNRLRLHSGLEYGTRGGLNSDSTYRSTAFSFGFQTSSTTISPQKLHQLELPLSLEYRIKNRHHLHIGGSVSYLLNVSSLVSKGTETDFGTDNPTSERVWGYSQGFNKVDASVLAGYQYYLGSGLYLGIHSRYGLRDLTDPAFFGNDVSDRNIRWQVSLTYDFLNF